MHSVTSSPATSMWMPARRCPDAQPVSARRMNVEGLVDLSQDLLEVAGLDAIRRGARIAVHGIAAPEHRLARGARGPHQRGAKTGDPGPGGAEKSREGAPVGVPGPGFHC